MSTRSKALLALIVAPPILTELASGNTSAQAFLNPRITLFLILAYSFPLLIIRELSLRWRLSTAGLFLLGLAYGIINEGFLAQTLLRFEHVPIDKFDHYLYLAGFNLSWACVIVPWHSFFAVLFPLVLLALWFPSCAQTTWLGKRTFALLAAILVALMAFISFARPPHLQMLVCFLAITALTGASFFFRNGLPTSVEPSPGRAAPFLFGLITYPLFFLGSIILAARRAPAEVFFLFIAVVLTGLARVCQRLGFLTAPSVACLALGAYFSVSLFHLFAGLTHRSTSQALTGAILCLAFLVLLSRRQPAPSSP